MANLFDTRPSTATVVAAAQMVTSTTKANVATGVFGIHDVFVAFDPVIRQDIANIGAKWCRLSLNWSDIQSGGLGVYTYSWAAADTAIYDCLRKGITPLVVINSMPVTTNSAWTDIDTDWKLFFSAIVARYKDLGIHYWEIFNEPNLPGYGWPANAVWPEGVATDYFGAWCLLMARAARILRDQDPLGVAVMGGISPSGFDIWAAGLYSTYGMKNCFDVFAYHPYGAGGAWDSLYTSIVGTFTTGGDNPKKPIWFTEWGTTNDATRAAEVKQSLIDFTRNTPRIGAYFHLGMRDGAAGNFGLLTNTGQKKDAWGIVRNYIAPKIIRAGRTRRVAGLGTKRPEPAQNLALPLGPQLAGARQPITATTGLTPTNVSLGAGSPTAGYLNVTNSIISGTTHASFTITTVVGATYRLRVIGRNDTSNGFYATIAGTGVFASTPLSASTVDVEMTFDFVADSTTTTVFLWNESFTSSLRALFRSIDVRRVG